VGLLGDIGVRPWHDADVRRASGRTGGDQGRDGRDVFRPWFGQALTVAIGVVCAVSVVGVAWQYGVADGLRVAPFLAMVAGACWAVFWRPHVAVDDSGVELVNILRTIRLPWPSIRDVDTKWTLTLDTAYGRFSAWAAPAPGAAHLMRTDVRRDVKEARRSWGEDAEAVRPGDLPSAASGSAALVIRERWQRLRDAGYLDDPRLEFERAPIRWHLDVLVGAAVLGLLGLVALVV
jgi:hypothetical protein